MKTDDDIRKLKRRKVGKLDPKSLLCRKIRQMPPYQGPHALYVLPWKINPAELRKDQYQVDIRGPTIKGRTLDQQEASDLKKYKTNTQAIWRRHRFSSPSGCDYATLKKQVQLVKYKAMLDVKNKTDDEKLALDHAILTSHYEPYIKPEKLALMQAQALESSSEDEQPEPPAKNAKNAAAAAKKADEKDQKKDDSKKTADPKSEKTEDRKSQSSGASDGSKSPEEDKKSDDQQVPEVEASIEAEEKYVEDVIERTGETRAELNPLFTQYPIGNFMKDPRTVKKYKPCYKKEKRNWKWNI